MEGACGGAEALVQGVEAGSALGADASCGVLVGTVCVEGESGGVVAVSPVGFGVVTSGWVPAAVVWAQEDGAITDADPLAVSVAGCASGAGGVVCASLAAGGGWFAVVGVGGSAEGAVVVEATGGEVVAAGVGFDGGGAGSGPVAALVVG